MEQGQERLDRLIEQIENIHQIRQAVEPMLQFQTDMIDLIQLREQENAVDPE